jgi:hypothetical protein
MKRTSFTICVLFFFIISSIFCTKKKEFTSLEHELLTALIGNFQYMAEANMNNSEMTMDLYLYEHIAHLKASIPESFISAMVLDPGGKIIALSEFGRYQLGEKIKNEATQKALVYRERNKPLIQHVTLDDGRAALDISLPVTSESDSTVFRGVARIVILRIKK